MEQKFNQEQIEHLAAAFLIDYFAYDSRTQTEFKLADKSPGYDGELRLYNISQGEKREKNKVDCTFHVQIKGTTQEIKNKKRPTFRTNRNDLIFFENTNKHCLYFNIAVEIVEGKAIKIPYYRFFSNFELNQIIEDMKKNNNTDRMLSYTKMGDIKGFIAILQNLKEDLSQVVPSQEDFQSIKTKSKDFYVSRTLVIPDSSSLESLYGETFTLYAKSTTLPGYKAAIGKVTLKKELFDEDLDFKIEFGDITTVYVSSASSIDRVVEGIEISKSIKLFIREIANKKAITVSFDYVLNEEETMETLEFSHKIIKYLRTNNEIKINNILIKFDSALKKDTSDFEEFERAHSQILRAMIHFEMNLDESIKNISERQVKELLYMYDIEQGKTINEEEKLVYFKFGLKVYYFLFGKSGVYNILSKDFESKHFLKVETDNETYEYVPNFIMVTRDIHKVYNFNFKTVQDRINESVLENNWDEVFNKYELELISDYDNSKDSRVLSLASLINKLLLEKDTNNILEKINHWQIIARKEGLAFDDIKELKDIVRDSSFAEDIHLAAKVL
ncbi:hypothetical protein GJW47_14650, partial [Listeria monocytogenes]|nr:hypothetical protein [Listeria monocytogenes]